MSTRTHLHTLTHMHTPSHFLSMDLSLSLCLRNQHVGLAHVAMSPRQPLRKDELKVPAGGPRLLPRHLARDDPAERVHQT